MPEADPGDIFLRHRGAVLQALLADPSLSAPPPVTGAAEGPDESEFAEQSAPGSPRRGDGPRASERILQLLNAGAGEDDPAAEFGSEFTGFDAARLRGERGSEPDEPAESRRAQPAVPADRLRAVLTVVRKPKVALAIGAVIVLIVLLALVTGGGSDRRTAPMALATATPTTAAAAATPTVTTTPVAVSGTLTVKSAQAHCPPGSTPGMDAFAGQSKAWLCVRAFKVDGQVLTIDLGHTYTIDSIGIVPGWDQLGSDGVDQWAKYRTASRVSYQFDDPNATRYTQQTLDQRTLVVTKLNPPVTASHIVLTVLQSKGDPSADTVAVSSIAITGR